MAEARKDLRGRVLRKGEVQRSSDKRYMYTYTYDHYVRETFGQKRIAEIKYSDVLQFYS